MVSDLVKYLKSLQDAERQVSRALKAVKQNEPAMYKMLLSQERQMATADGLGFTDEEIEADNQEIDLEYSKLFDKDPNNSSSKPLNLTQFKCV